MTYIKISPKEAIMIPDTTAYRQTIINVVDLKHTVTQCSLYINIVNDGSFMIYTGDESANGSAINGHSALALVEGILDEANNQMDGLAGEQLDEWVIDSIKTDIKAAALDKLQAALEKAYEGN